jgi:hypothetical protein
MRFKGTLILFVVCLALGSYLYFYEIKGGEQRAKEQEAENQVWKLESGTITRIDLITPAQHITAIRNGEKNWSITEPRPLDADSDTLTQMATSVANIRRENIVEQNAPDLAKYGLNPAQTSLSLKTRDGKEYRINFGRNNPTGSSAYATTANNAKTVFLVATSVVSAFDKKLDDLRNHSVLSFETSEAQTLSIKNPKGDLALVKDGNDRWWIEGKDKIAADSPEVRGILNALSMARIKEFYSQDAEGALNISKPLLDVNLTYGKNRAIKHLLILESKSALQKGGSKEGQAEQQETEKSSSDLYLAKDASRSDLFFVDKELVDKLTRTPNELREKALAAFQRWDIDSITLTNPKGSFAFNKNAGEWFFADSKAKAKWDAVNGILDAMEKPTKELIDTPAAFSTYGLDKPVIHVLLKQGGNVVVDCSLGKKTPKGVYALVKGDPAVKMADQESYDKLDISDFAEPPPVSAPKK